MERYQIILAYDGTGFQGFQRQEGDRTVQGEVEKALRQLGWLGGSILSAGRTDAGVHAAGQVIAVDLEWNHSTNALLQAMNANLPEDVAVRNVQITSDGFHPRYDAVRRTYHYHILVDPIRQPLKERYAWRIYPEVEVDRLHAAAQLLVGAHDFAAFGRPPKAGGSTTRQVFRAEWLAEEGGWRFEVTANAFLYHMVRRMVYLQVMAALGQWSLERLQKGVERAEPQLPGLAPPQGLVLMEVQYPLNRQEL
ncbi:MAG TPA: tRNA pseudouridine(38-40) synthase TruA [Anaerolineaceae bacterium]|jgi:tRNA pseudouridine38-40 synthase|nr:tRNA pseudouridine(38-40) synthase TruA [Longilinea sp.]NMD31588.1 tRNA pseudouridine(38-40) synthase TruA [Chloroflexota bacterium]HNS63329.1 tRNA pseudouridine(38-40) synthase TruA [Anaerolineaceae bacterium]HOU44063.1 tRNA pseudouridine(38-40) synthase TruA [Anaerolineaceae bacterium]HPA32750.1 tRNA pseudouridine(38-40) synthase TruA [Anaerolineaceae bacterium]